MNRTTDLAPLPARVGAALLDFFLLSLVLVTVVLASGRQPEDSRGIIVVGVVLFGLVYATPLLARRGAHNGQTLGKQALSIRVVRADAAPVGFGLGLLREFVGKGLMGLIPFFSIVDYLFPLADPRRQAIHDKIATTYVVHADAVPDLPDDDEPLASGLGENPFGQR